MFASQHFMRRLFILSGGAAFYGRNEKELNAAMVQIAAELRSRYTVAFVPAPNARKDGWHDVKLKLGELRDPQGRKIKPVLRAPRLLRRDRRAPLKHSRP